MEDQTLSDPEKRVDQTDVTTSVSDSTFIKSKINLKKFNSKLTTVISVLVKLTGLIVVVLVLLAALRQLRYDGYSLQEVLVPEEFEKAGLSGGALAAKIKSSIQEIKYRVEHSHMNKWDLTDEKSMTSHLLDNSKSEVEVSLVGVELSLSSVVNLISNSLGISRSKKIDAYISMSDGKADLSLYIQNQRPIEFSVNVDSLGLSQSAILIAQHAAESILKIDNTELLAYYFSFGDRTPKELDKVIELAKFGLAHDIDTSRSKYYEHMWAWALNSKGDYHEAFEIATKAIAHGGQFISAYTTAADALKELKQYENSRRILKRALKMTKSVRTNRSAFLQMVCYQRIVGCYFLQQKNDSLTIIPEDSVSYFRKQYIFFARKTGAKLELAKAFDEIGYFYSESGLYDSALANVQRAIAVDSNYRYPYYTLSQIHGYQKDREKFYYYFEKALVKGLKDDFALGDSANLPPPDSWYKSESRFKLLWSKYIK